MENPVVYLEFNKSTPKYIEITSFLKDYEHLLEWKPEEVVLDLGCGPGDVTACVLQQWLPADLRYLLGVDISDKMVEFAQATNTNDRLEFKTIDVSLDNSSALIRTGKYSDGFDKMFSFYVLHWLEDLE